MYQPLNENKSTMNTILDIAEGITKVGVGAKQGGNNTYSYNSLAQAASKLVAVFPVLASRTVSAETAQMVSKYIEQQACSMFMLALQQANISNAKSGIEYLKNYHQNINIGGDSINAVINTIGSWVDAHDNGTMVKESNVISKMYNESSDGIDYSFLFESDIDLEVSSKDLNDLMKIMKENENIQVYDTKLNPLSINDYVVNEFTDGTYHVTVKKLDSLNEAKLNANQDETWVGRAVNDADIASGNPEHNPSKRYDRAWGIAYANASKKEKDAEAAEEHNEDREYKRQEREEHKQDRDYMLQRREDEEKARRIAGKNVSILKDQDIKKMNDAIPSLLVVKFYRSDTASVATEFIIGVKSKLIPVTTAEILRRIMNDNKDGKKFLNLMRTITGELKASELLFGFSRIKENVKSTRNKGAYGNIWNLLANRADAANAAIKRGRHNDFSAITTVVISQNDADELFREENVDISDPKNALHFMKSYNLMGFVIVDDATEVLKMILDDGEKTFAEYAYRSFDHEIQDGTYKKLINLMASSK